MSNNLNSLLQDENNRDFFDLVPPCKDDILIGLKGVVERDMKIFDISLSVSNIPSQANDNAKYVVEILRG